MRRSSLLLAVTLFLSAGCADCGGGSGKPDASTVIGTCDLLGVDPKCGSACASDVDCPATLYCLSKKCVADCVGAGSACGVGVCGERGRCILPAGPDAGTVGSPDGGDCPRVTVKATELVPTVQLLIDRSGSMSEDFQGMTRWAAVKKALVDPTDGVVVKLQAKVRFGATLYTNDGVGSCPDLNAIDPAMNNAGEITKLLDGNNPGADTPTGESLDPVAQKLHDTIPIEGGDGPRLVVLATDGEPDTCANPSPKDLIELQAARDVAVAAARKGFQLGVLTFVLSVGTQVAEAHLQEMANAGTGTPSGNTAPFYKANNPAELVTAFDTIIRGARTCQFKLNGTVEAGKESTGQVSLNGTPLGYLDPDGWKLLPDGKTLELLGAACTTYKGTDGATLDASFACGAVVN